MNGTDASELSFINNIYMYASFSFHYLPQLKKLNRRWYKYLYIYIFAAPSAPPQESHPYLLKKYTHNQNYIYIDQINKWNHHHIPKSIAAQASSPLHNNQRGGAVSQRRRHHKDVENLMAVAHNVKRTGAPSLRNPGHIKNGTGAVQKPHHDLVAQGPKNQGVIPV